jgi:Putative zinc-finger
MDAHAGVPDLLGAWALDACPGAEATAVEEHLAACPSCAGEAWRLRAAAGWIGVLSARPAPAGLRQVVLEAARTQRRPSLARTLTAAYARQVTQLDQILDALQPADWQRPDPRHRDLRGMVVHLVRNDSMLAADLGLPVVAVRATSGPAVREAWRAQAEALRQGLSGEVDLDRRVRLVGAGRAVVAPLGDALVQRAFETWTHRDDVAATVGRSQPAPSPEQLRHIVDLAVRMLPEALHGHGISRGGKAGRIVLSGPVSGEWTFPIGHWQVDAGQVELTISADGLEFTRLAANRRAPDTFPHAVSGDWALATRVLRTVATLGCD